MTGDMVLSQQKDLLEKLSFIADNPENEFDKIIHRNKDLLKNMSEKNLAEIYLLRKKCQRLCGILPYKRDEIAELVNNGEVNTDSIFTKLEYNFIILEHIFEMNKNN